MGPELGKSGGRYWAFPLRRLRRLELVTLRQGSPDALSFGRASDLLSATKFKQKVAEIQPVSYCVRDDAEIGLQKAGH